MLLGAAGRKERRGRGRGRGRGVATVSGCIVPIVRWVECFGRRESHRRKRSSGFRLSSQTSDGSLDLVSTATRDPLGVNLEGKVPVPILDQRERERKREMEKEGKRMK